MENKEDLIDRVSCLEQGTREWFKARLGYITSSRVGDLMKLPRSKTETFTETAMSYLYQVAAERNLRTTVLMDDNMFDEYLYRTDVSNKAIRWGQENEDVARKVYSRKTGNEVAQCGFIPHKEIGNYGDSPDGIIVDENDIPIGAMEIKCPNPATFMKYKHRVHSAEDLKTVKPEYYWQCQSHCECNDLQWCDFIFFDKMQKNGFVCVRIERNDEDIAFLKERVSLANELINSML